MWERSSASSRPKINVQRAGPEIGMPPDTVSYNYQFLTQYSGDENRRKHASHAIDLLFRERFLYGCFFAGRSGAVRTMGSEES